MPVVISAAIVIGAVAAMNLLLTMAVIRRLREHEERLGQLVASGQAEPVMLETGDRPETFAAADVAGAPVDDGILAGVDGGLVGFFAPWCGPCKEWLPRFVEAAEAEPERLALAVLLDDDGWEAMAEQLSPVARVVVEPNSGPVHTAFKARAYPTMYRMDASGAVAEYENTEVVKVPSRA